MSKSSRRTFSPFLLPVLFFALCIFVGALCLLHAAYLDNKSLSLLDAVFTSTSALCVTGLTVVDTGAFFSGYGQVVILLLMQIGGLGVMTFTTLGFYLLTNRVSLTDRLAVGQSLLHDPSFHLGRFLGRMVAVVLGLELVGAVCLYILDPQAFHPFSACFHAVSAFCNAGFSLFPDSLTAWQSNWLVNIVFMVLIVLGGLGFFVLLQLGSKIGFLFSLNRGGTSFFLSWQTRVVLRTSLWLILVGGVYLFLAELWSPGATRTIGSRILTAVFQSVTCRTAGFNTVDIGSMTNISLGLLCLFMWIGGSPGSCAGGVKTTTFRAMLSFARSQIRGREQVVVDGFALDRESVQKALALIIMSFLLIGVAAFVLVISEGGAVPHSQTGWRFLEIVFETVSAFGTVGLSTGLTPSLSAVGKCVIIALMFIGRLGPILFISLLQDTHKKEFFSWPEKTILIG